MSEVTVKLERGYIPQPFWNDFGDAMMADQAVIAALDAFSFDGHGYSVATANRMREAFAAAFGVALTALATTNPKDCRGSGERCTCTPKLTATEAHDPGCPFWRPEEIGGAARG